MLNKLNFQNCLETDRQFHLVEIVSKILHNVLQKN